MLRAVLVDNAKNFVLPKDVATAAELREAILQAEGLISECERLAKAKEPKADTHKIPAYFN